MLNFAFMRVDFPPTRAFQSRASIKLADLFFSDLAGMGSLPRTEKAVVERFRSKSSKLDGETIARDARFTHCRCCPSCLRCLADLCVTNSQRSALRMRWQSANVSGRTLMGALQPHGPPSKLSLLLAGLWSDQKIACDRFPHSCHSPHFGPSHVRR